MINPAAAVVVFHQEYPFRFAVAILCRGLTSLWVVVAYMAAFKLALSATHKVIFLIKTKVYCLFHLIKVNVFKAQTLYASASFIVTGCSTGGLYVQAVLFRL